MLTETNYLCMKEYSALHKFLNTLNYTLLSTKWNHLIFEVSTHVPTCKLCMQKVASVTFMGDSSVFVLSRTGHFGYSSIHNSVNIIGRTCMLHLHGSCHICVSMCDQHFFVNNFNWLIYP